MKIVAFLQNMWVRNPAKARAMIQRDPTGKLREKLIAYALFAGCLTGRRLKAALGEDYCSRIVWDECSPTIADNPKDYHAPDQRHIEAVIQKHQPDVVICFSKPACAVVRAACREDAMIFIPCCHPAARGNEPLAQIKAVRLVLEELEQSVCMHLEVRHCETHIECAGCGQVLLP